MFRPTDDLRIRDVRPLIPPAILLEEIPISERASIVVSDARAAIADVIGGTDPRLVVVVGPCSIHDTKAAFEYAERLKRTADRLSDSLIIVTLGLFALVINGLMLLLTSSLSSALGLGFHVRGFWAAFWGALVVSLVSTILSMLIADSRRSD